MSGVPAAVCAGRGARGRALLAGLRTVPGAARAGRERGGSPVPSRLSGRAGLKGGPAWSRGLAACEAEHAGLSCSSPGVAA